MRDITIDIKQGLKDLDPKVKVMVSSKHFSLYDSISAMQIDKENMDNFMHNTKKSLIELEFADKTSIYKFIREIMTRIFQHLIKATSLSQSLFANVVKHSNIQSVVVVCTRIVYVGSLLLCQNSNYLLHEDYFLENVDSSREYFMELSDQELEQMMAIDLLKLSLQDKSDLKVVFDFLFMLLKILTSIKNYDYKQVEILLQTLRVELFKVKEILQVEEEGDVEFFDVDLNRHFYVQVQTKPAEFMGFKKLIMELNRIFLEWEWLLSKIKDKNTDIWSWVEEFVHLFPNATTLGRAALVNMIFYANGMMLGEFTSEELFGKFVWSWHGIPNLCNIIDSRKDLKRKFSEIQELWLSAIQVMCHNASRRHRKLSKFIVEWDLQERVCTPLDSHLSLSEYVNYEIRTFSTVMFDLKLRLLIYYLMIGFQLSLYSDMEVSAVCFYLIYLFKRRRQFLEDLEKAKKEPSLETLSISSNSLNFRLEILKCTALESFFRGVAYFAAYLYQKDIISFPKSRLFSFSNQYRYRFKILEDLNKVPFQGFDLYWDFWQNLIKEKDSKNVSKILFKKSMESINHICTGDGFLEVFFSFLKNQGKALVEACQINVSALEENRMGLNDGRYFRVSNGLFPHA